MRNVLYGLTLAMALIAVSCGGPEEEATPSGEKDTVTKAPAEQAPPKEADAKPAAPKPKPKVQAKKPAAAKPKRPQLVVASPNLVQNGSFEHPADDSVPFWRTPEDIDVSLDTKTTPFDGKTSLRADLAGDANLGILQGIEVEGGRWYVLRGWIKAEDLDGKARLEVQDAEKGHKAFCEFTNAVTGTADWKPASVRFQVPRETKAVNLLLRRPGQEDAEDEEGTVWFDRCELMLLAPATGKELIRNGGFEQGKETVAVWRMAPKEAKVSLEDSGRKTGKRCLQVTLPADANLSMRQGVGVKPGATYSLTGWVKGEDVAGDVWLEVIDTEKGWKSFAAHSDGVTGTQTWTPLSLVFTPPEGVRGVSVLLRKTAPEKDAKGESTIWFDDYSMVQLGK